MNKSYNTKNKFLKNIMFGGFLLSSFAGTFPQLQADPIHDAVKTNDIIEVRQLLSNGANPNKIDTYGYTPLYYTANPEMFDLLISAGADINQPNGWGNTLLRCAVSSLWPDREYIKFLLQKGANKDIKDRRNKTPVEALLDAIEHGIVYNSQFSSLEISDKSRLAYAEILPLFLLPQHLWPKRNIFRRILDFF
jgi:ankyrin repeat protein